jgi:hypothetical protein
MNAVLLTGAGFSHNWGGRLAREINTAVAMRLQNDAALADLLHRNPNFEEALTELQNEVATSARPGTAERLQKLETAIVDVFAVMNRNLGAASFNFSNDLKYSLPEFLVLFDAIFTLNQDLLLERHYLYPSQIIALAGTRRWLRGYLPGTDEIPNPAQSGLYDPLLAQWRPQPSPTTTAIDPQSQPYFKLHGSMNWTDPTGGRLLVMGGNKPTTMRRHPILTWYAAKFLELLSKPGARLIVIGYGFGDNHINQLIYDAWQKSNRTLTMFIVHPDGREILKKVNATYDKPIYVPEPLEEIMAYDSSRSLRTTFGGTDPGEHDILVEYAKGI